MSLWERPEAFEPDRGRLRTFMGTLGHRRAIVTAQHVRAEVEQLPPEPREAIELAYFAGRTYRQVAEELGIPEGTAKSRMRLGLRRIADGLAAKGMDHSWT